MNTVGGLALENTVVLMAQRVFDPNPQVRKKVMKLNLKLFVTKVMVIND